MNDFSSGLQGRGGMKTGGISEGRLFKESGRLFGQHFLSFPAISSLDANSLAVYKEASTYKSYLRFTLSPRFHGGKRAPRWKSYKEFK